MRNLLIPLVVVLTAASMGQAQVPPECATYTAPATPVRPVRTCARNTAYSERVLSLNPLGYWPLDDCEPGANLGVADVSGFGHTGTASANTAGTLVRGNSLLPNGGGSSIEFHAASNDNYVKTSDRVTIPGWEKNPTCNPGFTLELWISLHENRNYWTSVVSDRNTADWSQNSLLYFDDAQYRTMFGVYGQGFFAALPLNTPTHYVAVYDRWNHNVSVYFNGTLQSSTNAVTDTSASRVKDLFFGRDDSPFAIHTGDAGGWYTLDEIAWYQHPLTAEEVGGNFQASQPPPVCDCPSRLSANYDNTLVPDAGQVAFTTIELNTATWEVEFDVHDVLSLTNGHVIAAGVDARATDVETAISSLVATPFETAALWSPPSCGLSRIDTPAAGLGVAVQLTQSNCTRSYQIRYSLIDAARRTSHCQLVNTAGNDIRVECELKINTIRAYDATEPRAFLAKETVFRANITMPRNLPNEVGTLLHASLAKCSVYAAPDFYVDCRIPALWNFASTFAVTQTPDWIIGSSCTQTNGSDATFIRCDLQSLSQIYTEATATIAATVLPSNEVMHFAVNYSLPREETATATGTLATFVKSIGTKDGKFFYGNDDLLTLEIEVVDTSRLQITQLELFNSDSPVQAYNLRTTPEFETVETQNATHFVVTFYPSRKLEDSNFYLHGPHGVNVSFLFTAARRQQAGDTGVVMYKGIALKAPNAASKKSQNDAPAAEGLSTTVIAGVAAGALVAVIAVVAAAVVLLRKSPVSKKVEVQQPAKQGSVEEEEEVPAVVELGQIDASEV